MELQSISFFSQHQLQHFSSTGYDLWCSDQLRLVFVKISPSLMYYLPLTPSEYTILLTLLQRSTTIPIQELLTWLYQKVPQPLPVKALQHHMSRLKKKLPPGWHIICEIGFGYRLCIHPTPSNTSEQGCYVHQRYKS